MYRHMRFRGLGCNEDLVRGLQTLELESIPFARVHSERKATIHLKSILAKHFICPFLASDIYACRPAMYEKGTISSNNREQSLGECGHELVNLDDHANNKNLCTSSL
jgi:hypothetical protein